MRLLLAVVVLCGCATPQAKHERVAEAVAGLAISSASAASGATLAAGSVVAAGASDVDVGALRVVAGVGIVVLVAGAVMTWVFWGDLASALQ